MYALAPSEILSAANYGGPLELVLILKTYAKCAWPGPITPPPLECGWRHTGNVQGGGGVCECPRVGVFYNFLEGGWRHANNVQGVGFPLEMFISVTLLFTLN